MVSHDLVDGFVPKNAVKLCNECRKRKNYTATCLEYPDGIPKKLLFGNNCPDFEPEETDKGD